MLMNCFNIFKSSGNRTDLADTLCRNKTKQINLKAKKNALNNNKILIYFTFFLDYFGKRLFCKME